MGPLKSGTVISFEGIKIMVDCKRERLPHFSILSGKLGIIPNIMKK